MKPFSCTGLVGALFLLLLALGAGPAGALEGGAMPDPQAAQNEAQRQQVQPLNNAPVWNEVRSGAPQSTAIPSRERGVLVEPGGERWRQLRNGLVTPAASVWLSVAVLAVVILYLWKGPMRAPPPTGRLILRFRYVQRFAHWGVAGLFVLLALSGLIILLGRYVLRPVIGATLFGWLGMLAKVVHNLSGPLFAMFTLLLVIVFMRDNLPRAGDVRWLLQAGGLLTGKHMPAGKFNAGQKMWFWGGLLTFGLIMSASGFVLDFPNLNQTRATMHLAEIVHVSIGAIFIGLSFFHIYLGTIGQEGALDAMRTGYVDESWAKEHHELWYKAVKAGRVPQPEDGAAPASPRPANS